MDSANLPQGEDGRSTTTLLDLVKSHEFRCQLFENEQEVTISSIPPDKWLLKQVEPDRWLLIINQVPKIYLSSQAVLKILMPCCRG
jgi:hypothetical protein